MNNEKIIIFALNQKFSPDDAQSIYNVCAATPNPKAALEIVLGIYTRPTIPRHPTTAIAYIKGYKGASYKKYDPYTDRVHFIGIQDNPRKQWRGLDGSIISFTDYISEEDMLKSLMRDGDIEMESHFNDYFTLIDEIEVEDSCTLSEWGS